MGVHDDPGMERASILLVDDKPSRLLTYEVVLESLGEDLVRAQSGEEALKRLEDREFAAILLDVSMPGMDGFETARLIREHPKGVHTPIIFVTGVHISQLDALKGYELGAADYVYVPVVPEILRGKVQVLVELYRQRLELSRLNDRLLAANADLARAHEELKADNTRELQKLNLDLEEINAHLRGEVAERRRAERMLRDHAQRKDEFISILAHELRNPLSAIQNGIEVMRLPDVPGDRLDWAHGLVERQVRHLVRLIDDLLDVSRVSTGRVQLQKEAVALASVLEESIDATRSLIEQRRHEVVLELPEEPLRVLGDNVRLIQVFGNLLSNAARYMDEGGRITLTAEQTSSRPASVAVRVRDQGAGLAPEMLERVFDLFVQADAPGGRSQGGLGIGLALVRSLVDLHGGRVSVASDGPGRGCDFTVELPLACSESDLASSTEATSLRASAPMRLLIIDDNQDAARGMELYLRSRFQHELRVAHDGRSGVSTAAEFVPDVVLLDIGLPDMDGYEVARRLRGHPALCRVPLIAITGFGDELHRSRAKEAGIDHFLVKPVAYPELEDLLADCAASGVGD